MAAYELEDLHDAERQRHAGDAANQARAIALSIAHLPEERHASDAERGANGVFLLTLQSADEEQRRGVAAGDEQHERRRAEERQQDAPAVAIHLGDERLRHAGDRPSRS